MEHARSHGDIPSAALYIVLPVHTALDKTELSIEALEAEKALRPAVLQLYALRRLVVLKVSNEPATHAAN
jgi:hypothetical protein